MENFSRGSHAGISVCAGSSTALRLATLLCITWAYHIRPVTDDHLEWLRTSGSGPPVVNQAASGHASEKPALLSLVSLASRMAAMSDSESSLQQLDHIFHGQLLVALLASVKLKGMVPSSCLLNL